MSRMTADWVQEGHTSNWLAGEDKENENDLIVITPIDKFQGQGGPLC